MTFDEACVAICKTKSRAEITIAVCVGGWSAMVPRIGNREECDGYIVAVGSTPSDAVIALARKM